MLAAKFFDDHFYNNSYYAKVYTSWACLSCLHIEPSALVVVPSVLQVGGVPCAEINTLEIEFLFSINFSLHVMPDIYNRYHSELMNHLLTAEGCDCGEFAHIAMV